MVLDYLGSYSAEHKPWSNETGQVRCDGKGWKLEEEKATVSHGWLELEIKYERGSETRKKIQNFVQDTETLFLGQRDCMSLWTFFSVNCPMIAFSFPAPLSRGRWPPRLGALESQGPGWVSHHWQVPCWLGRENELFAPAAQSAASPGTDRLEVLSIATATCNLVKAINSFILNLSSPLAFPLQQRVHRAPAGSHQVTWAPSLLSRAEDGEPAAWSDHLPLSSSHLSGSGVIPDPHMSWKAAKRSLLGHLIMGWAYPFPALPLLKARKAETLTETLSGLLPDPELSSVLKLLPASGSSCTTWGRSPRPLGLSCSAGAGCWAIYLVRVGPGVFIPAPQFLAPDLPPQSRSVDIYHHEMKLHLTHIYGTWVYFTKLFNIPPFSGSLKEKLTLLIDSEDSHSSAPPKQ